jgi:translation initiation factor 2 beta subunit (eIF-2beta)/eIF-5
LTKGETVTKPIELGLKKADLQKPPKSDKKAPAQSGSEALGPPGVHVTAIPPRARKAKPEIVEQIGHQLIRVYKDVVDQPVPDRFLELLNALETTGVSPEKTSVMSSEKTTRETEAAQGTKKARK